MTLEQLGFKVSDSDENTIEYSKETEDSMLYINIDFKREEIIFGDFWCNIMEVWSAPLEVIQASIEVLNARKVVIDFDK